MNPYPHQLAAQPFLSAAPRRYLADVMGLGKTITATISASGERDALIVCPASVVDQWEVTLAEWAPRLRATVVSYDRLRARPRDYAGRDVVVLDEAHYVKTASAKRTKTTLKVAAMAPRAILLSGTPMPKHPGELWAPIKALWPETVEARGITNWFEWVDKTCYWRRTQYGVRPYAIKDRDFLRSVLGQFMLRRTFQSEGIELPELRVTPFWLPRNRDLEAALAAEGVTEGTSPEDMPNSATIRRILGEHKVPVITAVLKEELTDDQYDKIVVLAYHRASLDHIQRELGCFGVVRVDGSTSKKDRAHAKLAFNTDRKVRVFLGQQGAAGTGTNLQAAAEIALLEPAWSAGDNAQAIKRIHRLGQTRPCRARLFVTRGSLDEGIMGTNVQDTRMAVELGLND